MFDNLSEKLSKTLRRLTGTGRLTEDNIQEALTDVRTAFLEADVALPVIQKFIEEVKQKAIGQEVLKSLKPGEALVKVVHDELLSILGGETAEISFQTQPPAVILMAGLQGSGKTTTTAKLASFLKIQKKKSVLVVSADIYRPAAIDQLRVLAEQVQVDYFPSDSAQSPLFIVNSAIAHAKKHFIDTVIVDTAGRLHIDTRMMSEIRDIHKAVNPVETLFVVDSMTGQDAANTAKAFNDALPLTGIVLTKTDGDARGGAALSIRYITGKPIKFVGVGEKMNALEAFHPERMASRILGMGDILTLVEEVQRKVDQSETEKLTKKLLKGKDFDLDDFRTQLQQLTKMGGLSAMASKLPGMGQNVTRLIESKMGGKTLTQMEAIINSMTPKERRYPDIINGSRKRRIAQGSGTQIPDLNRLIKQFSQMQKMMRKMKSGGMGKMMQQMKAMMSGGLG